MTVLTLKSVRKTLRPLGAVVRYDYDYNEYAVKLKGGRKATEYYTSDLEDALHTGLAMIARGV